MGLFDRFKKPRETDIDPLRDLVLSKLKVGYFLDYDLDSYEVAAYNVYDIGSGIEVEEWALKSGTATFFLERHEDDEVEWSLSKKIPIGSIEGNVRRHIIDHDDPPDRLTYQGSTYFLDESRAGYFFEGGEEPGHEFLAWTFINSEDEAKFVTVEQWGEKEFEAAVGHEVEEYQFTNILPGRGV